jgi:thiol-disulfide isomerase/thioredoxin
MICKKLAFPFFLLLAVNAFAQIKKGESAANLHITNWIQNAPPNNSLKGKFLIVDFWATWCAPCLASVPHMNELATANKGARNLMFLSITDEKENKVRRLLSKVHFSSAVVADTTGKTFGNYRITSIPFCILIDDKMEVKWTGDPAGLTNKMIRQFIRRQPIVYEQAEVSTMSPGDRKIYDSLRTQYVKIYGDGSLKEYFGMGPLMTEEYGMQIDRKGPEVFREIIIGKNAQQLIARLLGVSPMQVQLPRSMSLSFVSYCYKSETKVTDADLLDNIVRGLALQSTTKDTLLDKITLEVTDTALFYADLPDSSANTSHVSESESGNEKFIALGNSTLSAAINPLQSHFACQVIIKDAALFNRKINMTIKAGDFSKFQESMHSYGVRATREMAPAKIYYFQ